VGAVPVTVCKCEWPAHELEPSKLTVGGLGTSGYVQHEAANLIAQLA